MVVAHAAAGLCYVCHAALMRPLDIVAEGEESVRAERNARVLGNPFFLFLARKRFGAFGEELLPSTFCQNVFVVVGNIDVDGVVAIGAAYLLHPRQIHHLRVLAQPPDVGLVAGKARAVNAALLSRTDTDGLSVLGVAHGVALRIFQRDERNAQVADSLGREGLVVGRNVFKEGIGGEVDVVASLLEGNAEHLLALQRFGAVVGVYFKDAIRALALGAEHFEGFFRKVGGNHAVAHFALDEQCSGKVAGIGKGDEIAVRRHAVCAASAGVSRGNGRERFCEVVHKVYFAQRFAHGQPYCRAGGRHVLERCGGGQACGSFQFAHKLPAVEGIEEVDVTRTTAEHFDGQFAVFNKNTRRFLIGIAAVFEF